MSRDFDEDDINKAEAKGFIFGLIVGVALCGYMFFDQIKEVFNAENTPYNTRIVKAKILAYNETEEYYSIRLSNNVILKTSNFDVIEAFKENKKKDFNIAYNIQTKKLLNIEVIGE